MRGAVGWQDGSSCDRNPRSLAREEGVGWLVRPNRPECGCRCGGPQMDGVGGGGDEVMAAVTTTGRGRTDGRTRTEGRTGHEIKTRLEQRDRPSPLVGPGVLLLLLLLLPSSTTVSTRACIFTLQKGSFRRRLIAAEAGMAGSAGLGLPLVAFRGGIMPT